MPKIVAQQKLADNITQITVEAPLIARSAKPGQFVVVHINEQAERIPLTIADKYPDKGLIDIIFQEAGASTKLLAALKQGDDILDILGPLGTPAHIENAGTVVIIGGGVGIAEIYPAIKEYKAAGNRIIAIIGARCQELLISRSKIEKATDELVMVTDDGSCGRKGFVTDPLKEMIEGRQKIDLVYAVGPVPMMAAVSSVTQTAKIKTIVSLNTLMLDATGMCGVCRITVGGKIKFACVDGPEFDAHHVDFRELQTRLVSYKEQEKIAEDHVCRLLRK